jgi:acetyl esterase/lipase
MMMFMSPALLPKQPYKLQMSKQAMARKSKPLEAALWAVLAFGTLSGPSFAWQPGPGHNQLPLWPGTVPNAGAIKGREVDRVVTEKPVSGKPWTAVGHVSRPTMTIYRPTGKDTGVTVVVYPGGGYWVLAIDLEGTEICEWLTSIGITAVLLKYRVPGDGQYPRSGPYPDSPLALQDAQRAMRLLRATATAWHLNPHKIGVLGFSAGGDLVAQMSTNYDKRIYRPVDAADQQSCRPDFAVALYPGHLWNRSSPPALVSHIRVTPQTPPTFLLQAENDPVDDVHHSLVYYEALKKAGVPTEMHLYAEGGHAFGLRRTKYPITQWPALVETWLGTIGMTNR